MKIAIVINGTRGDVQPMIALATGLTEKGHELIICAPPENKELAERYNCRFIGFGPNYRELFTKNAGMKGGATTAPTPKEMKKQTEDQINLLPELIKGSELVLGVGFVLGVHTVADILEVPYRFVVFYPSLLGASKTDPAFSRMLFGFGRSMTNMMMKGFINQKRAVSGLTPINDVWSYWMGDHVIAACDRELNAVRDGVAFSFTQTGYMLLRTKDKLPEYVESFLNNGKPPVYIGFGSNPVAQPEKFARIFNSVAKATNQRLIISKGWAQLPEENASDILFVDEIPFNLIFPRLAAIVFHGGTGTMASAARAGIPMIAFPFMADQFENRNRIVKLGLGPKACDFKKLSVDILISSINVCLSSETYRQNALEISRKLKDSDGLKATMELIETGLKN